MFSVAYKLWCVNRLKTGGFCKFILFPVKVRTVSVADKMSATDFFIFTLLPNLTMVKLHKNNKTHSNKNHSEIVQQYKHFEKMPKKLLKILTLVENIFTIGIFTINMRMGCEHSTQLKSTTNA